MDRLQCCYEYAAIARTSAAEQSMDWFGYAVFMWTSAAAQWAAIGSLSPHGPSVAQKAICSMGVWRCRVIDCHCFRIMSSRGLHLLQRGGLF